jgi:TetR/AcrR family transcriptional regulator
MTGVDDASRTRPRGRPRQGQSPVSQDHILEVALHAFGTQGYHGVSLRGLATELGVSHNLLHQQFGSKEGLWRAAVTWVYAPFVEKLAEAANSGEGLNGLRAFIVAFATYVAEHPDLQRLVTSEASLPSDRLDFILDNFIIPIRDLMAPTFAGLFASGTLRKVNGLAMYFLITAGSGAMFTSEALTARLFGPSTLPNTVIPDYAAHVADILFHGIVRQDG